MRRLTAEMSQWRAQTDAGSALAFERCKGGYFSTLDAYALRVTGREAPSGTQCVRAGTKVLAGRPMTTVTAWINNSNQLAYSSDSFAVRLEIKPSRQYELYLDTSVSSLFRAGVTSSSAIPVLGAPITLSPCTRTNAPSHITLNAGASGRYIWVQIAAGHRNAIRTLTVIDKSTGRTDKPFAVSEAALPCDLYEGDVWYPMTGKVVRNHPETPAIEQYDPQPIFAPQGAVRVEQEAAELTADLTATMLIRR